MRSLILESFSQASLPEYAPHLARKCLMQRDELEQPKHLPIKAMLKPAAVLLALVDDADSLSIILTKRTDHLSHHAGQICLPGGRVDRTDSSPVATALRETEEEIGLSREHVSVLGHLDEYETVSGFLITTIVGLVNHTFELNANHTEVAEIFEVPLDFVLDARNHQRKVRIHEGQRRSYYEIAYQDKVIWGATAGILVNFANKLNNA